MKYDKIERKYANNPNRSYFYQPAKTPVELDFMLEEREKLLDLIQKIVEIIGISAIDGRKKQIAAAKFEKVEQFIAVNNGWGEKKDKGHEPIKHKDRRAEGKQSGNLHCDDCNHSFDLWQAKCPRCAALAEKKFKEIEAVNENFKSFFNMILSDDGEPIEIHIKQNFPLQTAFTSIPKKRRGSK